MIGVVVLMLLCWAQLAHTGAGAGTGRRGWLVDLLCRPFEATSTMKGQKLVDCRARQVRFSVTVPAAGEKNSLMIAIPSRASDQPRPPLLFVGSMKLAEAGRPAVVIPIAACDGANWLQRWGHNVGCFLPPPMDDPTDGERQLLPGNRPLPGKTYDVAIAFSELPPQSASIWLVWDW